MKAGNIRRNRNYELQQSDKNIIMIKNAFSSYDWDLNKYETRTRRYQYLHTYSQIDRQNVLSWLACTFGKTYGHPVVACGLAEAALALATTSPRTAHQMDITNLRRQVSVHLMPLLQQILELRTFLT